MTSIQTLKHKLTSLIQDRLPDDTINILDLNKIEQALDLYSDTDLVDLEKTIDSLQPFDIEIVSHLFNFTKGDLDFGPDLYNAESPRNTPLPSLLFSLIIDSSELWPIISLDLSNCRLIPPVLLINFVKKCRHLKELILSGCTQLSDQEMLGLLMEGVVGLTSIGLARTNLSGDTLVRWVMANPDLAVLDLSGNLKLNNFHLEQMARGAPHLRQVDLSDLEHVEGLAIVSLIKNHQDIRKLNLDDCLKFSPTNFVQLKTHLQNLEELSIARKGPLICDFSPILNFIISHSKLAYLNIKNWQGNARDLTVMYGNIPAYREVTTTVSLNRHDILFPTKIEAEEKAQILEDIRSAYEEKKILLLIED